MRIAILEDDQPLADQLSSICEAAGHHCYLYKTGRTLLTQLNRETFDLLVLDWNVPDLTGLEVLQWAQANLDPAPPTIMVTSRNEEADIVKALESGADDYVIKPVKEIELRARVQALLRRTYPARGPDIETYDLFTFNNSTLTATLAGQPLALTAKEFSLALILFQNLHRPLSRAYLLERVWGRNVDIPSRTLDVHISRVRTRLGLRPNHGYKLSPVYSFGYRLERVAVDPHEWEDEQ